MTVARVELQLLGGFSVRVDGAPVPAFPRRHAAALVKLLALVPGHRLPCERALDALWPDLLLDEARPRLHKAAHYARRTLGRREAVVLHTDSVALFPGADVSVDVARFEAAADAALGAPQGAVSVACGEAADLYAGELLPEDVYEPWTEGLRERLRLRYLALLRSAGRWDEVLALDPADEQAYLALLRRAVDDGDRAAAVRCYQRMERALSDELGIGPGPEAMALRERAVAMAAAPPTRSSARPASMPEVAEEPRLVERDAELSRLEEIVTTTIGAGRGVVVLVTGEAGSGKTTLVRAALHRLRDRATVLTGSCDDLLVPRSLGPFRDIAAAAPDDLGAAFVPGADPEGVLPALLRLLAARPTVLVVEDVHWADDATLDAVRYLARRMGGVPSVLVLTYRDDELGRAHPLRLLLGSLTGASLRRIAVPPLSLSAVAELAGDAADPAELHRITRGNAFYVTEVLATGGSGVPETVRDAVLARLAGLSAPAQDVVQRLAVIPSRAERPLAEALAEGRLPALLEAERAGMVSGDAEHVWFRHELARAAVLSTLTAGELVAANRDVLDALLARGDRCSDVQLQARVVHHAAAGRCTDVLLRDGPGAAAAAAEVGAHRQAAETLRVVLEVGTGLDPVARAQLLTRRAYSLYYVNEFEDAWICATQAVMQAEAADDAVVLADALVALSKAAFWARGPLAARRAVGRAVELLEGAGDDARLAAALTDLARAHSNLATLGIVSEPASEAARFGERAMHLAMGLGRDDIRCQALFYLGSSKLAGGDETGFADLEEGIRLASVDPRLELKVRACVNAAGSAYRSGRFGDAERYVALGLRLADQGEFFGGEFRLRLTSAAIQASSGRWDAAIRELRELAAMPGDPAAMGQLARALLARLLARRGDPDAAEVLVQALSRAGAQDDVYIGGPLAAAAVELAWLRGQSAEMPALAEDVLRSATEVGHRASRAELSRYLQRAGHVVAVPPDAVGPWAPGLAGRWREAAAGWERLGERYEYALELSLSGDRHEALRGLRVLEQLGAAATLAVVREGTVPGQRRPDRRGPRLASPG